MKHGYRPGKTLFNIIAAFTLTFLTWTSIAGNLNLATNALEVVNNVEPNIMILHDDSGSMDWGVMSNEDGEGTIHLDGAPYYYTHPAPNASGKPPAVNDDIWVLPTEEFMKANGLADPQGGVWRAWHHNYNRVYYNPDVTYTPWKGVDIFGNPFTDVSPASAPYNPNVSANGALDLTQTLTYSTDCWLTECLAIPALASVFNIDNFYPARYYTWTDANSTTPANANNGVVDADDDHTLVEIKASVSSYTRKAYNPNTKTGRSDCTNLGNGTATCSYAQEIQNFANWFSYYRKRDLAAKAAFSKILEPIYSARVGYATINNNAANAIKVESMNVSAGSGAKKNLMDKLFITMPDGGTPLRSATEKTGKYYECKSGDIFGSSSDSVPGSADCPVQASPIGNCQANYTILVTDGYWNGVAPTLGNTDAGSGNFDGNAFSDTYSNTLADVAMHYYERDLHTGLDDEVPASLRDINGYFGSTSPFTSMHQHMSLYTVGFGVYGTMTSGPADMNNSFSWTDPTAGSAEKIDDVLHAAVNGRGLHSSVGNPQALQNAIENIFNDIKANSGTATAVAFNTQEVEAGTLVYRASFNTKTNSGDLVAQKINPNGTVDPVIQWSSAQQLDSKTDDNKDSRVIVTFKDTGSSTSSGIPFKWANLTSGSGSQQEALDLPQPANVPAASNTFGDERLEYIRGQYQYEGTSMDDGDFRERPVNNGKLGDIVHSTPVFVGKPQFIGRSGGKYPTSTPYSQYVFNNKDRKQMVYTGANDGMLHAFDANSGAEHFAFIPNSIFQNLSNLTDPNYSHRFYVDLTPSVNDIWFTPSKGTNSGVASWNTVLVGGLGAGGKGYYALNITDPNALDTETEAASNILWEFTEADDGGIGSSDLGYTFSEPLIAMSNVVSGGAQRWVAIFGNGYNSTSTAGDAYLYILFIDAGQDGVWSAGTDFIKINTNNGITESADGSTPNGIGGVRGIDSDGNGTVDFVYAGDLQGNLYRFDLRNSNPSQWQPNTRTIFKARYKADDGFSRDIIQPFTKRPIVVRNPDEPGYIVIAATGSWMTTGDSSDTSIQSIYGIWDEPLNASKFDDQVVMYSTTSQLVQQELVNRTSTEHGFTVRTISNNPVVYKDTGGDSSQVRGWYIDLDMPAAGSVSGVEYPGERAIRNLQIRGNILFVNTVIPRGTAACTTGAGGYELAFSPFTGGVPDRVIFDLNNDGTFDLNDNYQDIDNPDNIIAGMRFDNATPTDSAFIGSRRLTQAGDEIRSIDTNTKDSGNTGRTSWREID